MIYRNVDTRLTRYEALQLEEAKARGFLVDRSRRGRLCLSSSWWQRCEKARSPYVRVDIAGRHAYVLVDVLPVCSASTLPKATLEVMARHFRKHAQLEATFFFNGQRQASLCRIPAEYAECVAQGIVASLEEEMVGHIAEMGGGGHA